MSYEPTVSGFEEFERRGAVITTSNTHDLHIYRTIEQIPDYYLEPSGDYPARPRVWMLRTPTNARTHVMFCLLDSRSVIQFQISFNPHDYVRVQIPLDSWQLRTCDAEAVRAAIQQAWLNVTEGHPSPSIVNPDHQCLKVMTKEDYYYNHPPSHSPYRRRRSISHYESYQARLPRYYRAGSLPRTQDSSHYYPSNGYQTYYAQSSRRPEKRSFWGRLFS